MLKNTVSFMYNPEAPFGLELMAERKSRGYVPRSNPQSAAVSIQSSTYQHILRENLP
jgi:hypothetical protein